MGEVRSGLILNLILMAAFARYENGDGGWTAFGRQPGTDGASDGKGSAGHIVPAGTCGSGEGSTGKASGSHSKRLGRGSFVTQALAQRRIRGQPLQRDEDFQQCFTEAL